MKLALAALLNTTLMAQAPAAPKMTARSSSTANDILRPQYSMAMFDEQV
jgi:hypothetical protein